MSKRWAVLGVAMMASVGLTFSAATAEASSGKGADALDTVYGISQTAEGAMVTIYDAAPGVSNDELRNRLRDKGVTVLNRGERPSAQSPVTDKQSGKSGQLVMAAVSSACQSLRTAREWCGHRWALNGYEDPAVYFLDHTSSAWPVTASTTNWNQAQGIDSYYRWYTNGCPGGGTHCVHVYNGNYGATGWVGLTSWPYDSTGDFDNTTNVTIKLNDYYGGTAAQHRNTACHEMGHALGLDHNTSTGSCLYYARTSTQYPNSDDFGILPLIYGY